MALFAGVARQAEAAEVGAAINPGTISQLASAQVLASGASIAATTILASAPGTVSVEFEIIASTAGASGTVVLAIKYTDAVTGNVTTFTNASFSLATANVATVGGGLLRCKPGTPIQYVTTWSTAGKYDLLVSIEAI